MMLHAINTKNLNFSYVKESKVIENLCLKVPKNSIYGFLGPNGSGKTTTIRLILGLIKASSGTILIGEQSIHKNRIQVLSNIGALIENPSLYEHLSAIDNLRITANYRGNISKERITEVLDIVKLSHVTLKKVKTFSLGMKQRLGLAIALISKPELLILDEPTNGLDPKGILEMRNLITHLNQTENITILVSSHLLSEIEKMCTHVGIINYGKLVFQGSISELKAIKSQQLNLYIEVDNVDKSLEIIKKNNPSASIINKETVHTIVNEKDYIPKLIDELRIQGINIYQFKIDENLENLFLNLTK